MQIVAHGKEAMDTRWELYLVPNLPHDRKTRKCQVVLFRQLRPGYK
jgi:hypothetical protein